jgi:hypothetical protein
MLILNVLPYASEEVSTYLYARTPGRKPAQDIKAMVVDLSEAWWDEKKRTKSRVFAARHVLEKGQKDVTCPAAVKPVEEKSPVLVQKHLTCLKVASTGSSFPELENEIKSAYRRQALKHHPDRGGDEEMFKRVSEAYQELKIWLENPSYRTRRGVPGKWSYIGEEGKWRTPL